MSAPEVTIRNGTLRGFIKNNLDKKEFKCFLSIPYAKPPVDNLRFKAPQPPEDWEGVRDATQESPSAMQKENGSEDCLYLNVFTQNLPDSETPLNPRAVMVWIHSGSFTVGSNNTHGCGPQFLLLEDVVVVVINYRLGIFGFLTFNDESLEIPGNAGMKDMIQALKWVQRNITFFNGDPNNVTIFGESAGGSAVHYVMLSPLSNGLIHKAIAQSGSAANLWARGKNCTEELAKVLGVEDKTEKNIYDVLMKLESKELLLKSLKVLDIFTPNSNRPFSPVVEKNLPSAFLIEDPIDIDKKENWNNVPFLTGFTSREGMLYEALARQDPNHHDLSDFISSIPYVLKNVNDQEELANKIKNFYFGDKAPTRENIDCRYLLDGDNLFVREIIQFVKMHATSSSQSVFLYRFSSETKLNILKKTLLIKLPGAGHMDDLGYLRKMDVIPETDYSAGSIEDTQIRRIVALWTNFAKNGNPNPKEASDLIKVQWKAVTEDAVNYLDFGLALTTGVNPEKERMEFWEKIYTEFQ